MSTNTPEDDHAMLADSARKFFERGYTIEARAASVASAHGCATERWGEFAEMGWLALPLPEEDDGLGGSMTAMCALAEEMGRALVVEPWIASGVLAASLLAATGTAGQRSAWLPALIAGEKRIAFAAWEQGCRFDASRVTTHAECVDGGYRLEGVKELAIAAPGADALIVCAQLRSESGTHEPALFILEAGTTGLVLASYAMVDGRHAAHVRMSGATVAQNARLDTVTDVAGAIALAMDRALVVQCAETVGAMARALEITLDYVKTRKQFGRTLASNQVLQHRLVDLHVAAEETRALVRAAAQILDRNGADRRPIVAATKAYAWQAAQLVWEETVQMHGAIGMTDEYIIGHYARRLATSQALFGDVEFHLERLATAEDRLHASA